MNLLDLHCDTALELYLRKQPFKSGSLHVSLDKAFPYETYIQTMAYWCDTFLSDEDAYARFPLVHDHLTEELKTNGVTLIHDLVSLNDTQTDTKRGALLAVEDARLLAGDLSRLDELYARGVRFLTLTWGGESCIGGAHDTDKPLTEFGRKVVERCFALGIIPDVSHASRRVTAEVIEMAKNAHKPIVATHSNSFAVYAHTRNLTDKEFIDILETGGVVGVSLCTYHLTDGACAVSDVVRHIKHYLSLGGENALCLGCDFDGIDTTPDGIPDLSALPVLYGALLSEGISEKTVKKIFFENAFGFIAANI